MKFSRYGLGADYKEKEETARRTLLNQTNGSRTLGGVGVEVRFAGRSFHTVSISESLNESGFPIICF